MRLVAAAAMALAALALSPAAHASLVQDATGLKLQMDAGYQGDAADACGVERRQLYPPYSRSGMMIAIEDPRDVYVLDLVAGDWMLFEFVTSPDQQSVDYEELDYFLWRANGAGCGTLVDAATKLGQYDSMDVVVPATGAYWLEGVHVAYDPPEVCALEDVCISQSQDSAGSAAPRTACYPACSTVNRLVGYSLTGTKLN